MHAQILNDDIDFLLFYIIMNKIKQQITENQTLFFWEKLVSDLEN